MRKLLFVLAAAVLGGCVSTQDAYYQAASSGYIGCSPGDIAISHVDTDWVAFAKPDTWAAACAGRRFYCTSFVKSGTSGEARQVACKEALDKGK